ncbi:MAG: adenylate/guanylate cyclase domain-containing protein [Bacteroidota bacterium]
MFRIKPLLLFLFLQGLAVVAWAQQDEIPLRIQAIYDEHQSAGSSIEKTLAQWLQLHDEILKLGDHPQFSEVCMAIADIYKQEQLFEQALPYYRQALSTSDTQLDFAAATQSIHQQLAQTYAQLSKPDSAYYHYNIILDHKEKTDNVNGQINTLRELTRAYMLNEEYSKALDSNLKIRQLLESNQRSDEELMIIYNNLGYNYNYLQEHEKSIDFFEQALELLDKKDHSAAIDLHTNIGIAYCNLGQFDTGIKYLIEARKMKSKHRPKGTDETDQLLATAYFNKKDFYNALEYIDQSQYTAKKNQNYYLLTDVYYTAALIHSELFEYEEALEYYRKHLSLKDSLVLEERLRQQQLLQQQINLERTEKRVKLFLINKEVQELAIAQLKAETENQQLVLENQEAQLLAEQNEKELLRKETELLQKNNELQAIETERAKQALVLTRQSLKASQQEKEFAILQQKEAQQQFELQQKQTQLEAEQNEKSLLLRDKEISALELQKERERIQFFYGIGALLGLFLLLVIGGLLYSRKLNRQLNQKNIAIEQQKTEISAEKKKSDELLLNILPESVAAELKETGKAAPKRYENVTVMFTDFKDFTPLVASIPVATLIEELNDIFSCFDDILEANEIEKIETIGDAYLAVCGLPQENPEHAIRCVNAAHQMLEYLKERNHNSTIQWRMRVGIHTGPVVAGVVGKKKFAYDVFGDSVNTASRIESNGEPGRINISQTTYEQLKDQSDLHFESRGRIAAKGKGEINMWFVSVAEGLQVQ